jgi:acetyl-CoA acetyltransferase
MKPIVAGVGMTCFGVTNERLLKDMGIEAARAALRDANIEGGDVGAVYAANVGAGIITGQCGVLGQTVTHGLALGRIPVVNIENACASASSALHLAHNAIAAGQHDIVLVLGVEKLSHADKSHGLSVFAGCVDVDDLEGLEALLARLKDNRPDADAAVRRSLFMDIYAARAQRHMDLYGTTQADFAQVVVKNSGYGALNPLAQFRTKLTLDEVLAARTIAFPLTLPMCSPVGDGAAAAVLVSEVEARRRGLFDRPSIRASVMASQFVADDADEDETAAYAVARAYAGAAVGPDDIAVVELHDASAPAELMMYEAMGFVPPGGGADFLRRGLGQIGSRLAVNTSGGLLRKGHPIGATGLAQIYELVLQLRGLAGNRQVESPQIAMAENGGGLVGAATGACVITILERGRR